MNNIMGNKNNLSRSVMKRRKFISTSVLGVGGFSLLPSSLLKVSPDISEILPVSPLFTTKINVKIINGMIIHEAAWEGSCRAGDLKDLTYESEMRNLHNSMNSMNETLSSMEIPEEVHLLKPVTMYAWVQKGNPEIILPDAQLDSLVEDDKLTDLYVTSSPFIGYNIAKRYRKPICILQKSGWGVDGPGGIRTLGVEAHYVADWAGLFEITRLMMVRKAFNNTKLLNITNFPGRVPWGVVSNIRDLDTIKSHYGMDYEYMNYKDFFGYMDEIEQNKDMIKLSYDLARLLLDNAQSSNMTIDIISKSVLFYLTVTSLMQKQNCNAFTIECFELCSSLNPWNRKFTPCLTNALLKDNGLPASCEGDINALLAMMVEMYLSRRAIYMGNPSIDIKTNQLNIRHSVASLKMFGIDGNISTPYEISSFMATGYGATLRHDFGKYVGEKVTVGRFNPNGTKMIISSGEVIGGGGLTGCGCDNNVTIKIPNGRAFLKISQDYGHHLAFVYGDYVNQIEDLSELMNFEVENIT